MDLCEYLEPWFVEPHRGHVLTRLGMPVEPATDGHGVFSTVAADQAAEVATLTIWLQALAGSVRDARLHKATRPNRRLSGGSINIGPTERERVLPRSIEGLIAYVGMT